MNPEIVMEARTPKIAELVEKCARKEISFESLCYEVARMGYKTNSLYEMVRSYEQAR